ncbi:ribose-5-phosphate isomerase RpiA [Apilactobacillus ozensis]|uniref:Ribose-5-phosphate isomerase A n=1 Tax=Apilactobacillus ozensis DSM 23829 = JCM 17196 TaxID=1423781 RepID=A0A0R2ARZ3_9LACO|nr:ribose-5-phosphate isomerase RpiA [Apilactobacillus ozensis]KRM69429.1 ribose-5-phosphate isomerase A [Apilactobacillus ozensis DSM 23829 = JCM 17196]MCK8607629.1 ribose-5-phosphate isomerase RpiA [Apilactobacillus ozensis]
MDKESMKKIAGQEAVKYIKDGMTVGLGTGSTVKYLLDALGARVVNENLRIIGVPTSNRSAKRARDLGIEVRSIDDVDHIDLTIDGADQIDENFQGIKGGGIAHLREKIVAINSDKNLWIVDDTKMAKNLGSFPLPLEVTPYGSTHLLKRLDKMGFNPKFRTNAKGQHVLTHADNYIIDLNLGYIEHPHELEKVLNNMTGIVEHGLFLDIVDVVIAGTSEGPKTFKAR